MRGIVAERLEEGWTEGQITDFFVERYGPSVLMEPPSDGANVVVWLVPPLGLALAGVALFAVLRQMRRKEPLRDEGAHVAIGPSGLEGEEYRRRALVALAGEGLESPDESFGESSESREEGAI
jgi:cytochrome c-type biogenesis protein CcmH